MTTATLETSEILARARRARGVADRAEAEVLAAAVAWAAAHEVTDLDLAATWGDSPVPLAGPGAPLIAYGAVAELASALGLSTGSGRLLLSQAIELAHRLPLLYERIQRGRLPSWRGRRIAEQTLHLSEEAVAYVDQQVAPFAHKTSRAQTQRLVDAAITRYMPELAQEQLDSTWDNRHVTFEHQQVSFTGTSRLTAELDMLAALELDHRVTTEAAQLADLGSPEPLDVRRATALGNLAGQPALQLTGPESGPAAAPVAPPKPSLVVYLHLTADGTDGTDGTGSIENKGPRLLTREQILRWISDAGSRAVIKPVIDLTTPLSSPGYAIPERIREHVVLRDRTCVFPHCARPARRCDLDHVVAFDDGGPTSTENLAALCRHHHRLKTHHGWTYTVQDPGIYLWSSPHGLRYLRDHHGTEDLTPRPLSPPSV